MSARLRNLNPYELHKYLVNVYCLNTKGSTGTLKRDTSRDRTDLDIIRENYKFLWTEDDVADTWEKQLAKKYCDKLFKEYCICDLSRYKENKVSPTKNLGFDNCKNLQAFEEIYRKSPFLKITLN